QSMEPSMALSRFRTRSRQRDRETDFDRLRRLQLSLGDIRKEMERERNGLRARYEKVTTNAASSLLAMEEDDSGGAGVTARIGDMTDTLIRCARRMASLESQIGFVTDLDRRIELFSQETAAG